MQMIVRGLKQNNPSPNRLIVSVLFVFRPNSQNPPDESKIQLRSITSPNQVGVC